MCKAISWIEKNGEILFLDDDDILSKRGKKLIDYNGNIDIQGHGAVRWFWDVKEGVNKECSDFSNPDNFPEKIVNKIIAGKMTLICNDYHALRLMLTNTSWAQYKEDVKTARAQHDEAVNTSLAQYDEVVKTAWAQYDEAVKTSWIKYDEAEKTALAQYCKAVKPSNAKYNEVAKTAFWNLFSEPKNRNKKWR